MAATPHPLRDLDDVEELLLLRPCKRSRGKGDIIPRCRLEADAAINAAVKLKSMVDAGDVRLVNPEMLASKLRAKDAIEEAIKEMVEQQLQWSSREIQEVDSCIAILNNRLQIPDADIPLPGPSLAPQGKWKVIDHCIYPECKFGLFPPYDLSAGVSEVEFTPAQEEEARATMVQSQRTLWTMNLKAHEAKKMVLEEYAPKVEKAFHDLLVDTLEMPSFTGAGDGYAEYGFLFHAGQLP